MEFMRIDGFLGKQLSKVLNKALAAKFSIKPELEIKKFNFESIEDAGVIKVDISATMSRENFEKLIEEVTK